MHERKEGTKNQTKMKFKKWLKLWPGSVGQALPNQLFQTASGMEPAWAEMMGEHAGVSFLPW